jgi:hypothetical protein
VDAAGNLFLGGYTTAATDYGCGLQPVAAATDTPSLVKLDPAGNCLWSKVFTVPAPTLTDQVKGVAVDAAGNVYIILTFFGQVDLGGGPLTALGGSDIAVAKYSPAGVHQWSQRFGDGTAQNATAIAADAAGNVFVAGNFAGAIDFGGGQLLSAGGYDVYLAKLTTNGAHVWSKRFGDGSNQSPNAVTADAAGNVLITGDFAGAIDFGGGTLVSAGLNDVFVAKLGGTGSHLWSKRFGGPADDASESVRTDAAGNVGLIGLFASPTFSAGGPMLTNQGGTDTWMAKLDPAGNHLWSRSVGGAGNQRGNGLGFDAAGNMVTAGNLDQSADYGGGLLTSAGATDIVAAKYDTAGGFLWAQRFGGVGTDFPRALAMDPAGNAFLTGVTTSSVDFGAGPVCGLGGEDAYLVKLGP